MKKLNLNIYFAVETVDFIWISEDFRKFRKLNISETKGTMNFKQPPKGVFLHVESLYSKNSISVYDGFDTVALLFPGLSVEFW